MPVVRLFLDRIERLLNKHLPREELARLLLRLKSEAEFENGYVVAEINSDRPDLMISEGIARALKGLLDIEAGLPRYNYFPEKEFILRVERVDSRPYIVMATIRDLNPGEDFLIELIQFQEKMHSGLGRERRRVAIGIHDLSKIRSKECVYKYVSLDTKMIPLHYGEEMSIREVLTRTEQGVRYGQIALSGDMHPAIVCGGDVISLPPVINSDLTRLESSTRDLLIDVTGTDLNSVIKVLEILTTTLAENSRTRSIGKIFVSSWWGAEYYPRASIEKIFLERSYVSEILGFEIRYEDMKLSLERSRFGVEEISDRSGVYVLVPPYRVDILHKIDLVEDIAISYGIDRIEPLYVDIRERGLLLRETRLLRRIRDILAGLGFTEIMGFVLSSVELYEELGYPRKILIRNPVSQDFAAVRTSMTLSMINILSKMQNEPKPVKVYEINDFVIIDDTSYTSYRTRQGLSIGIMNYEISFEDIQSVVFSLLRLLGLRVSTRDSIEESFWRDEANLLIRGRRAGIYVENKYLIGVVGEVDPLILEKTRIRYPVAVASIDLSSLIDLI